jgi:putative membrane protein
MELLDPAAQAAIRQRVAALESATGVELVAAVIPRADSYPEIPWRAFALGASLAGAAAVVRALLEPGWSPLDAAAGTAVTMLSAGGAAALLTVWAAPFARLFLPRARRQAEVLQYAQATFLEGDLHRTRRRDAILLLVSLFEREVVGPRAGDRRGHAAARRAAIAGCVARGHRPPAGSARRPRVARAAGRNERDRR